VNTSLGKNPLLSNNIGEASIPCLHTSMGRDFGVSVTLFFQIETKHVMIVLL